MADEQDLAQEISRLLTTNQPQVSVGSGRASFRANGRSLVVAPGSVEQDSQTVVNRRRRGSQVTAVAYVRYLFIHETGGEKILYLGGDATGPVEILRQPAQLGACPEDDPPIEIPPTGGWATHISGGANYPIDDNWRCSAITANLSRATIPAPDGWRSGAGLEFFAERGHALDANGNLAGQLEAEFMNAGPWQARANSFSFFIFPPTQRFDSSGSPRDPVWYIFRVPGATHYPNGFGGGGAQYYDGVFWVVFGPRFRTPPPPDPDYDIDFSGWSPLNTAYEEECGYYDPDDPPPEAFRDNDLSGWLATTSTTSYIEVQSSYVCGSDPARYQMYYYEYNHSSGELTLLTSAIREGGRLDQGDYSLNDWRSRTSQKEGQERCYTEMIPSSSASIRSGNIYQFVDFADASETEGNTTSILLFNQQEEGNLSQARVASNPITVTVKPDGFGGEIESCDQSAATTTTYTCICSPAGGPDDFDLADISIEAIVPVVIES